jgi:membrane-associated phospholipid phosphatase
MHVSYALVVAASLIRYGAGRLGRVVGVLYVPFVLLVVVATGNHFFFDAVAGAIVAGIAAGSAFFLARPTVQASIAPFPKRAADGTARNELAA